MLKRKPDPWPTLTVLTSSQFWARECADLLEEIIYDDDYSPAEVGSTQEVGP